MSHPTLTLWLKLPHDPTGTGDPQNFLDGTFKHEATIDDFIEYLELAEYVCEPRSWVETTWKLFGEGFGSELMSQLESWLESDPSRFTISGDTAVRI